MPARNLKTLHREFLQSKGVSTDSREPQEDRIFFAMEGERFDGNRFAGDALKKGARLAVTRRKDLEGESGIWVTPDPLRLLQDLAAFHRQYKGIEVLAVTGSNGKTTTKNLLASVLGRKYRVLSTRGNLNNHIGVPLTLLAIEEEELAVVEMGANHGGEITRLCEIADPGVGMITNVGKAHLEGFGTPEGVLRAKAELYTYLSGCGGKAIVDGSDPLLSEKAAETGVEALFTGSGRDLRVDGRVVRGFPYLEGILEVDGKEYPLATHLSGAYNFQNIRLASAAGCYFGVPAEEIVRAITEYVPENQRSQVLEGARNRIILDAYNANPSSMRQALEGLSVYREGPTMAVLGDMAELGDASVTEHRSLVEWTRTLGVDRILLTGPTFLKTCEPSGRYSVFRDRIALEAFLADHPPEGYTILVKGSRVMEMERIIPLLM